MNTMRTKRAVWPLALLATAFLLGCQEQTSSPVEPDGLGPQLSAKKCVGDMTLPGCGSSSGSEESATVVLGGGYSTKVGEIEFPQDINFQENGRRVVVRTEDGAQIDYSVDITLPFNAGSCVWSGLADAEAESFWDTFKADAVTLGEDEFRNLLFRVNKKENTFSDGEHRTEARWWVEDEDIHPDADDARVMYLVKVGVPGKVLADQLSEKLGTEFEPAIGTFNDVTKTVTITGGAVRLSRHKCGAATGGTAGCGPQAPTEEVACINPTAQPQEEDPEPQVFIATVTIP